MKTWWLLHYIYNVVCSCARIPSTLWSFHSFDTLHMVSSSCHLSKMHSMIETKWKDLGVELHDHLIVYEAFTT